MGERLIPNGDAEFAQKARLFANRVSRDPQRYGISTQDAETMKIAATRFDAAFQKARYGERGSRTASKEKNLARAEAARIYKRCVKIIRLNEDLDNAALIDLGLKEHSEKRRARVVPQEPPYLSFVQALHVGSGAAPMHELEFRAEMSGSKSKPAGATRLELFVDLIAPGEPIPAHPGANHGGRPWYLRSYSRSPIKLAPPMCRVPMMIVYWGRWADAIGNVGPWSKTVSTRIEGYWPHAIGPIVMGGRKPQPILEDPAAEPTTGRAAHITIAVLDSQYLAMNPQHVSPALPDSPQRPLQIEGPPKSEAA
jgi:hypothetical protein